MEKRDSMVFYRSFYEAIKELPAEQQVECFHAIMDYALDGTEPEGNGIEKTVFILVRPQIDTNNKRYQNGSKGGRPKTNPEPKEKQSITKEKPKDNQTITKVEPNVNVYVNENVNASVKTETTRGERFPEFWENCPKQQGKQMAMQCYLSLLHSTPELSEDDLLQAIKNYAEACRLSNTQERFIKKPANWLSDGVWMDYTPDAYKRPAESPKSGQAKNRFNAFPQREYTQSELQSLEQRLLKRAGNG